MFSILTKYRFNKLKSHYPGILVLAVFLSHAATAQVIQSNRLELSLGEFEASFEVANAREKGLFLYRTLEGQENQLELTRIDTALQVLWSGFLKLGKNSVVVRTKFYGNSLYVLTRHKDFSQNDLTILIVNAESGSYVVKQFRNYIPLQVTSYDITQRAAILGGYFNKIPVVLYLSFAEEKSKVVPGLFSETGELTQVRTYDDGSFDVLVSAKNIKRQQTIFIRNYDQQGNLLKKIPLEPEGNKNFIFGRSLKTYNDNQVVAGVYGNRNSEYSKGIYIASIDPLGNQQIQYYSYGDLENFFKFMKARREQRVKERIERRKTKGRKSRLNYRFMIHELIPYKDQYVMLGEAFYPRYIYSDRAFYGSSMMFNYANVPNSRMQNGRIFDGYTYTHAVVIGFSGKGKLLWDNSFEINDVRTYELEQFVKIDEQQDRLAMLYLYNHQIRSKIIQDNKVLEGKSIEPIKLKFENDFIRKGDIEKSKLEYWYDQYFYAFGVQKISNTQQTGQLKRKVFFLNKVNFADQ